jgi:imidazolonepropionase
MDIMYKALIHASELITGAGVRKKQGRNITESDLNRIPDGAIVYSSKKIIWVGPTSELPSRWGSIQKTNLHHKKSIIPGLVDCHNHLLFAGDRSEEFAARCAGASYQEIAKKGGGIQSTVRATRSASLATLEKLAIQRLKELEQYGTRTVEIKTGYGLSIESELKLLSIIPRLRKRFPHLKLTATFLGAHAFPTDRTRADYLQDLLEVLIPKIAKQKLADSCDVFIDEGYFTIEEGHQLLEKAKTLGLNIKIHADELGYTGATLLAVKLGALSADHLLKISSVDIQALAHSKTVAVLLPGTAFTLKTAYPPARALIDAGAAVALATDFNPGTCYCLSLPIIMSLAALYLEMSHAEIFTAVTYNAAQALGLHPTQGTLEVGQAAYITVLPFQRFEESYYRLGWSPKR